MIRFAKPTLLGIASFLVGAAVPSWADAPGRVVSMNVCTDQLAMLIAQPGQLISVSYLATDPGSSVLAEESKSYGVNHGLAEEVFLMQPDLVLAGTFTTRSTVGLLRRLGVQVEEFAPESSFDDVRANIMRMGGVLGQKGRAVALVEKLNQGLAKLADGGRSKATVATYYANSYTSGQGTLVDAIIKASGLTNLAASLGLTGTARLPLEILVLANPDIIADGRDRYDTPALAEENFSHPAYRQLTGVPVGIAAKYTICGAPFTLEAARILQDVAQGIVRDE